MTDNHTTETFGKISLKDIVTLLKGSGARCTCDLDNWEPEVSTGHSWVCNIHKEAMRLYKSQNE